MTVLQDFKAACVVGARFSFTAKWCQTPTVRTVRVVRSKDVGFDSIRNPGEISYLTWPKASEIRLDGTTFVVQFNDIKSTMLHYTPIKET